MEVWEDPTAGVDTLIIMASRDEVEADDVSKTYASLDRLLNPETARKFKGRLIFGITGYDSDPRELFEIPETRTWMQKLNREFPFWFYFMWLGYGSTLSFVVASLCRYDKIPGGNMINNEDLLAFITTNFATLNRLAVALGETEQEINDRSREISDFFFPH